MTRRTRGILLGAAVAIGAAWTGLQFWLAHRAFAFMDAQAHARTAAWYAAHPGMHLTVTYVPASYWTDAGANSVIALLLVVAVAAALAAGGRRWWTLLVAALPAAVAVGHFQDGTSIGQGWNQPTDAVQTWLAVGVAVDTATLLVIAALLVVALSTLRSSTSARISALSSVSDSTATATLFRAAPAAVVLAGWWLARHPIADPADRIWLAQAIVWVVLVALLASSSLPLVARSAALALMPVFSFTIIDDFVSIDGHAFDGTRYLHHLAVAVGIAAYVTGVPAVTRRLRARAAGHSATSTPAGSAKLA